MWMVPGLANPREFFAAQTLCNSRLAGSPLFAAPVYRGGNGFGEPVRVETLCANRMRLLNSRKRAGCRDTFLLLSDLSDFPRLAGGTS
eukprot:COSAG02_NODE_3876_length_6103_cov_2.989007_1_plen_88_part_00